MGLFAPDQIFGAYRLVSPLSRGGMGEVWRALKRGTGGAGWSRQVALKVILPTFADVEIFTRMFSNEARIAASLVHANIVTVSDFGREAGVLFLEQELVDGMDLGRLIERVGGGLPLPLALFITLEALKGLAYAHNHTLPDGRTQTVIHRDIKPANVLVAREGHVKLTDFGVAKVWSGGNSVTELRGTIGYLAPEIFDGQVPSPRSDLFAVGLVFWELLTGRKLFGGESDPVKLLKTYECQVPPLAEQGLRVAPEIEVVLRRLLARDPAARYASAEAVIQDLLAIREAREATSYDLKRWMVGLGIEALPTIDSSLTPPPPTGSMVGEVSGAYVARRSRKAWLAVAGGLSLLAIAAAAIVATREPAAPPPPAPAPAVAAAVHDAPAARVRITIDVRPAGATVTVNGRAVTGPPFVAEVDPRSTVSVRAEREGHLASEHTLAVGTEAVLLPISLAPQPPPVVAAPADDVKAAPPEPATRPGPPKLRPSKAKTKAPAGKDDGVFSPDEDE